MKRINYLSLLLIICTLTCSLFGCQDDKYNSKLQNSSDEPNSELQSSSDEPEPNATFFFHTYQEFISWIGASENEQRDDAALGSVYYNFVNEASKNQSLISIPFYDGTAMKLREKEGFSGIVFMSSELYNLPWIWYYGNVNGNEIVIKQACLSQKQKNQSIHQTPSQFIKELAPDAPNIHNSKLFSAYKTIKEITITLSDGTVSAMTYEFGNDKPISVLFLYQGSLFMVTAEKEVLEGDFFRLLSMVSMGNSDNSDRNESK